MIEVIETDQLYSNDNETTDKENPSIVEVWYCDYCKKQTRNNSIVEPIFDDRTDLVYELGRCYSCNKIFLFIFKKPEPPKPSKGSRTVPIPPSSSVIRYSSAIYMPSEKDLVFSYPIHVDDLHKSIPSKIKQAYIEAKTCMMFNTPNASSAMFRRTLQIICKNKGAKKKWLKYQIDEVIPPELKEDANEIKNLGNIGAHPDDIIPDLKMDDVKLMKEFTDKLLYSLYEYPDKIKSSKKKSGK